MSEGNENTNKSYKKSRLGHYYRYYAVSSVTVFGDRHAFKLSNDIRKRIFGRRPCSAAVRKEVDMGPNKRFKVDSVKPDADVEKTEPEVEKTEPEIEKTEPDVEAKDARSLEKN